MKRILVAEDNKDQADSIRNILERSGFEVILASEGREALNILAGSSFDMVMLDIIMPVLNGLQVIESIRNNPKTANIPVIILTNLDTDDKILNQINRDKVAYYLLKSNIDLTELVVKVKDLLGENK